MIQIKNLVWASAISTLIIAVIYDGDITYQRGASRMRMHSALRTHYSGHEDYEYNNPEYYNVATADLASASRSAPNVI